MIDILSLSESDIGRTVRYDTFGKTEFGTITSWNGQFVFVRYHTAIDHGGKARQRTGCTSEATSPQDLTYADYDVRFLRNPDFAPEGP